MKILIVDDESLARERLVSLLAELDSSHTVIEANNGLSALEHIQQQTPDVVLLDIRMPLMDGVEVARHLANTTTPPAVIFTTAFQKHALEAFETNAVDYLLKPVRKERLQAALQRAHILQRAQLETLQKEDGVSHARSHLSATKHGDILLVPVQDIRYLKAEHKYTIAAWPEGELLLDEPLISLEEEFKESFTRVHRNALAAIQHIDKLSKDGEGGLTISFRGMKSQDTLQVSRRHASQIRSLLKSAAI